MNHELCIERAFECLVTGDRSGTHALLRDMEEAGVPVEDRVCEIFWPLLETISRMYRADQLSVLSHHFATRLLRQLVVDARREYEARPSRGRKILLFCGATDVDEIAGHLVADLVEADGYEVWFGGGGVANDEIMNAVGFHQPDILLLFGSTAADAPNIRSLIDSIREQNACPDMQIVVGGGVFNRAEGLAEEIGADLWVRTPRSLLPELDASRDRRAVPAQRTVGRRRKAATADALAA